MTSIDGQGCRVTYLVLDEADRMLDKGFENDIRTIISFTKPGSERQTVMCMFYASALLKAKLCKYLVSATWPESVRRLASTFQRDPVRVTVGSDDLTANSRVTQLVEVFNDARSKEYVLVCLVLSRLNIPS
jgi:ATP-dependent RNA helicase DBP3